MSTTIFHSKTHLHRTESSEHLVSHDAQFSDIGRWLKLGWMDMARAPGASLFYGSIMALSVALVYLSFITEPVMMFKIATFFVLLSPFLATGLWSGYTISYLDDVIKESSKGDPKWPKQNMILNSKKK